MDLNRKGSELKVIMAGRGTGKSYWSGQAIDRLMKDLMSQPVEDLIPSQGTVYGSRYYCIEPIGGNWLEMETWCYETFGETGSIWQETKNLTPEPHKRWYANNRKFWFRNEKDRDWFVIKWSR
jgi:hypothetical protein